MTTKTLVFGQDARRSKRFLVFVVALSVIAAGIYAGSWIFDPSTQIPEYLLAAVVVVALVGTTLQSFRNDGLLVGGLAAAVLLTTVFLAALIVETVDPVGYGAPALPLYVTFVSVATAIGLVASSIGVVARRLVATLG